MSRPHIEFIQAQALPWRRGLPGGLRNDVEVKLLSRDADTGACTAILRYPEGWARPNDEMLGADEEFFVLAGQLEIGGIGYGPYDYAYLPAGHVRKKARSARGAVVLTFFEAEPRPARDRENFRPDGGFVERIDTNLLDWKLALHDPKVPYGLMTKTLRIDPDTKERTWMNSLLPGSGGMTEGSLGAKEFHPVVEEMFQVSGDLCYDYGRVMPGGYFWRPPGKLHGPFGTRTGYFQLFRCKGGPLVNNWTEPEHRFTYDPPHAPVLPPDLMPFGAEPYTGQAPY